MTAASTPKIIGICGYPGHGKSTAQSFLTHLGVEARDDAEVLRQRVMKEFNLTEQDVYTQEGKLRVVPGIGGEMMTVRKLLGDYGQIYGEQPYGPNYWIDQAITKVREDGVANPVCFASLRRTQAHAVKAVGGLVIAIHDPRKPVSDHYFDAYDREPVDVTIINNESLQSLKWRVLHSVCDYIEPTEEQWGRALADVFRA